MPSQPCRLAVVQHPPVFLNLARSVERAVALIRDAVAHGAQCIVFPETWLPGYPVWLDEAPTAGLWDYEPAKALHQVLSDNAIVVPGPEIDTLRTLAREGAAAIVMGAHERAGGTLYNTMVLIGPDGDLRVHRKVMPTYTERMVWGMGDGSTLEVLETPFGRVGGLICWEHWMPLARAAMHARGETIHVAQWPGVKDLHLLASRHYAFEGQCFVAVAGAVLTRGDMLAGFDSLELGAHPARTLLEAIPGDADRLLLRGHSAIVAPDTSYLAGPAPAEATTIYADLDPGQITRGHLALDVDGHYARPDIFQLTVNDRPRVNVQWASDPSKGDS
jgi:predicted amidohydrolase